MKVLRRIAKFNNKEIPSDIALKSPKKEKNSSGSLLDLFRSLHMAKQTMVQFYAWYADCLLVFAIFAPVACYFNPFKADFMLIGS